MFADVDESWLIQVLHLGDDQSNERKIESSGGLIKMDDKGFFMVLEIE
jgi:hypothetical protein